MAQDTIKQTKSLSPLSYAEIEAKVIKENGNVYLVKQDEEGTVYKNLLEKDYEFYQLMTEEKVSEQALPVHFFVSISSVCNLNCQICYEPENTLESSLADIKNTLRNFYNKDIILCGKEPTCRKDILQIIKITNKRNQSCLLTNGLKLSDYEYTLKLKKSGLKRITFSFNGFKDQIYQILNGRSLLNLKLQALKNAKIFRIQTTLSATLARGINDDQIKELCNFCFDNRSFVTQLRIRSISPVGKHLEIEPYCMSELLDIVASSLEIKREDILNEHIFLQEFIKSLRFILPFKIRNYARSRLCSFLFHLKKGEKFFPLGRKIDLNKIKNSRFKILLLVYYFIKMYGFRYIFERILFIFRLPNILVDKNILMISLRCWPNIYNIDLEENKKCLSLYYKEGKTYPFCYYNIIGNKKCP